MYKLVIHGMSILPNRENRSFMDELIVILKGMYGLDFIKHPKKNKGKVLVHNYHVATDVNDLLLSYVYQGRLTSVKFKKVWR